MHDPGSKQSRSITPIEGPEAFEERGESGRLSQAAFILSTAAGLAGEPQRLESSERFPLPDLDRIALPGPIDVSEAVRVLDVDAAEYSAGLVGEIPSREAGQLARDLYDKPDPMTAAALVEASLHAPTELVRTAAAVAALDTTGPRADVLGQLETATRSRDRLTHDMARTALAGVQPDNPKVTSLKIRRPKIRATGRKTHTAAITHGTFASRTRWWRPNGAFYAFLNGLVPALHMHTESFQWSGAYSVPGRDDAADDLVAWIGAQGLTVPDFFAHSHGVTVANLSTVLGAKFDRLIMLNWPVHKEWLPLLSNVDRVIDIRVRFDLVAMADRGGQRLPARFRQSPKVSEHIHGWFKHSLGHDPHYWDKYDLPSVL